MNAQLLNPFTIDIPDSVSSTLSTAECSTLLFNHGSSSICGQYLAVGRNDGLIAIWDIETKSVLRVLSGHVRPVTGLSWSRNNRFLASCSGDWTVVLWDLAASGEAVGEVLRDAQASEGVMGGERKRTIRFDCAVASVQFSPKSSGKLVVVLTSQEAWLVDVRDKVRLRKSRTSRLEVCDSTTPHRSRFSAAESEGGITAARFTPDARFVVAGTSKGNLLIFEADTGELLDDLKVLSTSSGVKELAFDAGGKFLAVNCNDRAIRLLSVSTSLSTNTCDDRPVKKRSTTPTLTLQHKILDMIQRTSWTNLGFSPSSDYLFAGAAHKASHNVYVWDRSSGTLSKILEGPKDWSIGVDWHPTRPMLASASNTGAIYVWFTPTEEIWSAYAPGFEELEENMEYEEREDEFDLQDGKGEVDRLRQEEVESAVVRVGRAGGGRAKAKVRLDDVLRMLDLGQASNALDMVVDRLDELCFDSGWKAVEGESGEQRLLEYMLLDQDDDDTFVIPPRLEVDYSEFHDDHI